MGIQLREIGAWARERKFAATLLVAATLAIGILIGTVISGRVNATHSILPSGATPPRPSQPRILVQCLWRYRGTR